jgi:hypothetical protein
LEVPDLLPSTFSMDSDPMTSNSWSPGAYYNPFVQDSGNPFEDCLDKSLESSFSTCDLADIPFLDLSQALSDPEETFLFDAGNTSQLYLELSQLQKDGPTIEVDEQFFQPIVSFREPKLCEKKGSHTPAWKPGTAKRPESSSQIPK